MKTKLVIFDADSFVFTIAYRFKDKKAKHLVTMSLNKYISDIISNCGATHYIGFFGSKEDGALPNFRYDVFKDYKAKRPPTPEWVEKWRPALQEEMKKKWSFIPVDGMEADDAVSICAHHFRNDFDEITIAAEDKDLKQVPEIFYYNTKKHEEHYITEFDGNHHLAIQALMGDSTDGIPGLPGIGPAKAKSILKDCSSTFSLKSAVIRAYKNEFFTLKEKLEKSGNSITEDQLKKDYAAKGVNLTSKQVQRKLKILNKGNGDAVYDTFTGGWKAFLKMNFTLVRMLTEIDEVDHSFNIPDPIKSNIKSKAAIKQSVEAAKKEIFGDTDVEIISKDEVKPLAQIQVIEGNVSMSMLDG